MKIELLSIERSQLRALRAQLTQYPELAPILKQASTLFASGAFRDHVSGAWLFGPDPTQGPFAFRLVIFPALTPVQLSEYESKVKHSLPGELRALFLSCNGLRSERLTLFGAQDRRLQMNPEFSSAYQPFDGLDQQRNNVRQHLPYAHMHPIGSILGDSDTRLPLLLDTTNGGVVVMDSSGVPVRTYPTVREALASELCHR